MIRRAAAGLPVQPAAEDHGLELVGLAGQQGEDFLRYILRRRPISTQLAQRRAVNDGRVLMDQLAESIFRPVSRVIPQEFPCVMRHHRGEDTTRSG